MFEQTTSEIKEKIRKQLSGIGNLPAIPHIITEVTQLLDNDKTSASDLCKVISKDQALATKILAVANSPLYGLPRRVATIEFAIVIIGFEHIRNILLALSLLDTLRVRKSIDWNHNEYWAHSLMVATAAKRIADDLKYPKSGEVFTVGLLHDLGLVILNKYMNYDFKKIVKMVKNEGITYHEAERIVLGYDHGDIAEFMLERWNFPPHITDAIVHHHRPSLAEKNPVLASLIHLVDYMTYKLGIGNFTWDTGYEFDENIIDILGFGNHEYLEEFILSYEELLKKHFESLN
ncbi:MAG: HDOD domain-containing protein [Melioribacter sp.]|uniref:HDOD domain-containing protein n=1 Tax=Rosettibacter primus TaxID=3111523 RepID=UPI00247F0EEA|nr:HDOD domain-containing protein [Melioribacter sp.]